MPRQEPPSAVTAPCPDCGEETIHNVLNGRLGTRGEWTTLDATVQCAECNRTHHVVLREANDIEVPAVINTRDGSARRVRVAIPGDAELALDEGLIADGLNTKLTAIELPDGRRVETAHIKDVGTLWLKEFEDVLVGFAINLGHKTITKGLIADPGDEFTVGEEHLFGRLRVTVHAIKTKERLLKRGSAEAADIVRIFARPTPLGSNAPPRPDKMQREQRRAEAERSGKRPTRSR